MEKAKKTLIFSIAALAVAACLVVGVVLAWISVNKNTRTDAFGMEVTGGNDVSITLTVKRNGVVKFDALTASELAAADKTGVFDRLQADEDVFEFVVTATYTGTGGRTYSLGLNLIGVTGQTDVSASDGTVVKNGAFYSVEALGGDAQDAVLADRPLGTCESANIEVLEDTVWSATAADRTRTIRFSVAFRNVANADGTGNLVIPSSGRDKLALSLGKINVRCQ